MQLYGGFIGFAWSSVTSAIYAAPLRIRTNSKPLPKSHMSASFHASLFQNSLDLSRWTFLLVLMHLPARREFNECQLPAANCIYMTCQRLASCIVSGESFLCRFMGCTLLGYPSHCFPPPSKDCDLQWADLLYLVVCVIHHHVLLTQFPGYGVQSFQLARSCGTDAVMKLTVGSLTDMTC